MPTRSAQDVPSFVVVGIDHRSATTAQLRNFDQVMACDTAAYARWSRAVLDRGISLVPSAFETIIVSAAHTDDEISRTIEAFGLVRPFLGPKGSPSPNVESGYETH